MKANLGKTGSLVEEPEPTSQKRDAGRPHRAQEDEDRAAPINEPFKFSPELMAKFEEVERMDPNDPTYAARVRAAAAEGTKVLKEQGINLIEISPVASR